MPLSLKSAPPAQPMRPPFRTTFGTVLTIFSRIPMARRHQRASTAILLVLLFFSGFTVFSHHQQHRATPTHHQQYRYAQHGMPFLRPSSYLLKRRGQDEEPLPTSEVELDVDELSGDGREYGFPVQEKVVVQAAGIGGSRNGWRPRPPLPPLRLDPSEELAALIHFITAIPTNAITDVDPNEPVPAELLLGFNTRSGDRARAELDNVVQSTWFEHPVVIFSLVHSPKAREVKKIVDSYKLLPKPVIIEVDERRDAEIISPLLNRLTASPTLPILLVGGKPAGTVEQIQAAHEDGSLKRLLADAGAVIGGSQKKKKKKLVVQYSDEE